MTYLDKYASWYTNTTFTKSNSSTEINTANIMEQYNFDMGNFEGDWTDDPAVRESILREAAEQVLWDSVETVPDELLEDFWPLY